MTFQPLFVKNYVLKPYLSYIFEFLTRLSLYTSTNKRDENRCKITSNMLEIKFKQLHSCRNKSKSTEKFIILQFILLLLKNNEFI